MDIRRTLLLPVWMLLVPPVVCLATWNLGAVPLAEVGERPHARLARSTGGLVAPGCWIRGEPEDLELRISPLDSAAVEFAGDTVKVCYSRPRKLGRPVMGRLVPYGEPWRLGANEATVIHLPFAVEIAGVPMDAGSYSLYAIPGESEWRIVVNREVRRWGVPIDADVRREDVASGIVPVERLDELAEMLTIGLFRITDDHAEMTIEWERTRVTVPIWRR